MRSLEEWTRYLEQQEQLLQQKESSEQEPVKPERMTELAPEPSAMDTPQTVEAVPPAPPKTPEPDSPQSSASSPSTPAPSTPQPKAKRRKARKTSSSASPTDLREEVESRKKLLAANGGQREVAQRYYSGFKETREELLGRLLDPQISLEDAARILNVCPTTVRRYTNKGILKHYRTPGNQRRFRLSDVLSFMEDQMSGQEASD